MMNNTIQLRVSDDMKAKIEAFAAAHEMNVRVSTVGRVQRTR